MHSLKSTLWGGELIGNFAFSFHKQIHYQEQQTNSRIQPELSCTRFTIHEHETRNWKNKINKLTRAKFSFLLLAIELFNFPPPQQRGKLKRKKFFEDSATTRQWSFYFSISLARFCARTRISRNVSHLNRISKSFQAFPYLHNNAINWNGERAREREKFQLVQSRPA